MLEPVLNRAGEPKGSWICRLALLRASEIGAAKLYVIFLREVGLIPTPAAERA